MLGPLSHDGAAAFGRRDRAVLTALAMCVGRAVSADRLADAVWGDDPPASSHKALQGCVVRLRKALGADAIETSAQGYRLACPPTRSTPSASSGWWRAAVSCWRWVSPSAPPTCSAQALELWRGRAFEDVESWDPAVIEAGRLDELRLEAEELRVDASPAHGTAPGRCSPRRRAW